jgi:hypothetical protein
MKAAVGRGARGDQEHHQRDPRGDPADARAGRGKPGRRTEFGGQLGRGAESVCRRHIRELGRHILDDRVDLGPWQVGERRPQLGDVGRGVAGVHGFTPNRSSIVAPKSRHIAADSSSRLRPVSLPVVLAG